jgi:hypothetical protein
MNGSTTPTATTKTTTPSDVILTFLQEILEAWRKEQYHNVATKCLDLLKRKKTLKDLHLTGSLQRILLQAYLQLDAFDKVLEWSASQKGMDIASTTATNTKAYDDLVLYARYRTEDYANVVKEIDSSHSTSTTTTTTIQQHLKAQSQFHLQQPHEMVQTYQNSQMVVDNVDVLTNVMASVVSFQCLPMVRYNDDNNNETDEWIQQATKILLQDQRYDDITSTTVDLAFNLGIFQFLTDPESSRKNWLHMARDMHDHDDNEENDDDAVETALSWSRHFWYKDLEDVRYEVATGSSSTSGFDALSGPQSVAKFNQALWNRNLNQLPSQPHPKWNRLQRQIYWYNRAILQLQAQQYVECRESCQSLRKTIYADNATTKSSSSHNTKKKKNKGGGGSGIATTTATTASPSSSNPSDLWWETRIDVVLAHGWLAQSKSNDAWTKLDERLDTLKGAKSCFTIDHAMAHVLLHRHVMEQGGASTKSSSSSQSQLLKVLHSLPESIKACPAVQLTMNDLQSRVGNVSETKAPPKTLWEQADILFGQGQYQAACNLYKDALADNISIKDDELIMDSQLRYMQALALTGQNEASQSLWQSLQSGLDDVDTSLPSSLPDGNALEQKALPRTSSTGNVGSSLNRNLVTNGGLLGGESGPQETGKPSRDKILRYRARKREEYLKKLESKGLYNPDRPVNPNPERWIPKHERSRSRNKGRINNNNNASNNRSAQGGGSQLDAQRLDAAARRAGKAPLSTGPSSANIKVSTDGKKGGRRR